MIHANKPVDECQQDGHSKITITVIYALKMLPPSPSITYFTAENTDQISGVDQGHGSNVSPTLSPSQDPPGATCLIRSSTVTSPTEGFSKKR